MPLQSQLLNWIDSKSQLIKLPRSPLESAREILRASDQTIALRATNEVKVYHLLSSTLDFSPEQEGQDWFAGVILASGGIQENLNQIAEALYAELFLALSALGRTPPAITPSPPGSPLVTEQEEAEDREEPANLTTPHELKHKLLRRDGFKCCFTGAMDYHSYDTYLVGGDGDVDANITETGHIIPFPPNGDVGTNFQQYARTAVAREILGKWAPSSKNYTVDCHGVDHERNAITLTYLLRQEFGRFNITLKSTTIQHRYELIGWARAIILFRGIEEITFENHDKTAAHDLPDSKLIAIHYAISNILHTSGAIEAIKQALEEEERTSFLASDGSKDALTVMTARLSI